MPHGRIWTGLLSALLVACASRATTPPPQPAGQAAPEAEAALGLIHTELHADMFPRQWSRASIRARATPLPRDRADQARAAVERALARYDPDLVRANLTRVYLVRDLMFAGIQAGGTNSRRRVYVSEPRAGPVDRERQWRRLFHAEFSSVLLRRHRHLFDPAAWARMNIQGFRYGTSSHAAVRRGLDDIRTNAWTLKQGFLYEYAMSTIENDFNSFAAYLFTDARSLWALAARYPAIAHKLQQTLSFFAALDPAFTVQYFRETSN